MGCGDLGTPAKPMGFLVAPGQKGRQGPWLVWSFKSVFSLLKKKKEKKGKRSPRDSLGKDRLIEFWS